MLSGHQFGNRVMTLFHERWSLIDMILLFQLLVFVIGEFAVIWGFATAKAVGDQVLYLYWTVTIPLFSLLVVRALLVGHRKKRKKV